MPADDPGLTAQHRSLERARRVQLGMLPRLPAIAGLEIHAHYAPCDQVGGDFYDLVPVDDGRVAVIMGDVAGHGLDAALVMASAKKSIQVHSQNRPSSREVLQVVAADLAPELPTGVFFTAFHGVIDMQAATLRFVRAGHSPLLRYNPARSAEVEAFQPAGMPVGAAGPDLFAKKLEEQTLDLRPGDLLVLFTDGLAESMSALREEYGEERLHAVIREAGDAPPDAIAAQILADTAHFRGGAPAHDDVTLVVIRYTGAPAGVARPAPAAPVAGNLPPASNSFVGRTLDRRRLAEQLVADGGLLCLTGPGGVGKTRLALEVARDLQDRFPGGCWIADCADAVTPDGVANAVAQAFGLPITGTRDSVAAVTELLRSRPPLLLICDNLEQAVATAPYTVGQWHQAAPDARLLVTSRIRLGVTGEQEFAVGMLAVPPERAGVTAAEAGAFDAVKLLLERGRQARPDFDLDSENAADIAAIVRALDGMPLALELAATRLGVASPAEIVGMLDRKFELLHTSRDDVPDRQRSLEAAIDFSYEQLSLAEQYAFQQLSIFRGGCLYESAAAVLDIRPVVNAPPLLDVLQGLREKSFVRIVAAARTTRFELYSTLRDYAARAWERAAAPALRRELALRFVQHHVAYAEDWSDRIRGPAAVDALDRLEAETENCFAAFDHAIELGEPLLAARVILALAPAMMVRGPADQRVGRLEQARAALAGQDPTDEVRALQVRLTLELSEARAAVGDWTMAQDDADMAVIAADALGVPALRGRALHRQAAMRQHRADFTGAAAALDAAERQLGDAAPGWLRADLLIQRAVLPLMQGATDVAARALEAAEPAIRRVACPRALARLAGAWGIAHAQRGEFQQALQSYAAAESHAYEIGDAAILGILAGNRGNVLIKLDDLDGALAAYAEAEGIDRDRGNEAEVARHMSNRADVLVLQGRFEEAVRLCTEAVGIQRRIGSPRSEAYALQTRADALRRMNRHEEARDDMLAAIAIWDTAGADVPHERFELRARLALTEHALGNRNEARRQGAMALDLADAAGIDEDHADPSLRAAWAEVHQLLSREGTRRKPKPE